LFVTLICIYHPKMSDSEDDANLPSAAECQQAIDNFVQITQTDEALAQFYLQVPKV